MAKAGETYTLSVRDKRHKAGDLFHYRVEVERSKPNVAVFLPRREKLSQARQAIEIPAGNRSLALFGVRKDQCNVPLDLRIDDLNPGVQYVASVEQSQSFLRPVVFQANASATASGALVSVGCYSGENQSPNSSHDSKAVPVGQFQQVVDLIAGPADSVFHVATVDRLAVAVTATVPYSIEIEQPTVPLAIDGTLELKIRADRRPGFDAPLDVTVPFLPEGIEVPEKVKIPSNENSCILVIRALPGTSPVNWPMIAEASVGIGESKTSPLSFPVVCSSLRNLDIVSSPVQGTIGEIATEQGSTIQVPCNLELGSKVPARLMAVLEGLPNRIVAEPMTIDSSVTSVQFVVHVNKDAPLRNFPNLVCRLTGELDGQQLSYCVARNTKLVVVPRGASQKDESGRSLSPLRLQSPKKAWCKLLDRAHRSSWLDSINLPRAHRLSFDPKAILNVRPK
ncbi:MAG: hypothetical protein ABL921_32460 [Pirellula sp.]